MNARLLVAVRDRIVRQPQTFRMGAYITEIGAEAKGCLAMHAIAEAEGKTMRQLSREADNTVEGYEGKRACELLEITADQGRTLFHLQLWPVAHRLLYKTKPARAAAQRIEHFIATNGVE